MQQVEGNYKADDGKDYYELALNIQTGDKLLIKMQVVWLQLNLWLWIFGIFQKHYLLQELYEYFTSEILQK